MFVCSARYTTYVGQLFFVQLFAVTMVFVLIYSGNLNNSTVSRMDLLELKVDRGFEEAHAGFAEVLARLPVPLVVQNQTLRGAIGVPQAG